MLWALDMGQGCRRLRIPVDNWVHWLTYAAQADIVSVLCLLLMARNLSAVVCHFCGHGNTLWGLLASECELGPYCSQRG